MLEKPTSVLAAVDPDEQVLPGGVLDLRLEAQHAGDQAGEVRLGAGQGLVVGADEGQRRRPGRQQAEADVQLAARPGSAAAAGPAIESTTGTLIVTSLRGAVGRRADVDRGGAGPRRRRPCRRRSRRRRRPASCEEGGRGRLPARARRSGEGHRMLLEVRRNGSEHFAEELAGARVLRVVEHLRRAGPVRRSRPLVHEDDRVGDLAGEADLVGDDDQRGAGRGQVLDDRRAPRRPARGRARRSARRTGSRRAAARAPGRSPRAAAGRRTAAAGRRRPCRRARPARAVLRAWAIAAARLAAAGGDRRLGDVVQHGQVREQVEVLEDEADPAAAGAGWRARAARAAGRRPGGTPISSPSTLT